MVAYTGRDTKIMQNSLESHHKISNIEKKTNMLIIYILLIQVVMCVVGFVGYFLFLNKWHDKYEFFVPTIYS